MLPPLSSPRVFWLALRLGAVLGGILMSKFVIEALKDDDFSQASLVFALAMTTGSAVAVLLFGSRGSPQDPAEGPLSFSWFENPFNLPTPLGVFHLGAITLISLGLGMAVLGFFSEPKNWAWEIPLSVGVGSWIGVRAASRVRSGPGREK